MVVNFDLIFSLCLFWHLHSPDFGARFWYVFMNTGSSIYICPSSDDSPFLSQLTKERVRYLFWKLWVVVVVNSYEIGIKSVMKASRRVLAKEVGLFFIELRRLAIFKASWSKKEFSKIKSWLWIKNPIFFLIKLIF